MNRIDPPDWARKPSLQSDGLNSDDLARLHAAREVFLSAVHTEVSSYLSDPLLVFDSSDEFPCRHRLTGDYYVGDEFYRVDPATGLYRISVTARCLARPLPPRSAPGDYLGLEVWLESAPDCRAFSPFRNTDSSVI